MPKLRAHNLCVSLDGFSAGVDQRFEEPFGDIDRDGLTRWMWAAMEDRKNGKGGIDVDYLNRADENIGATIMGRNMFSPQRGPWEDESWRGWWGPNPPYHHPVYVRTHHLRPALTMDGGTVFHFTDADEEAVRDLAFDAAGGKDVRIGGGPSTVQAFLRAGLVDELHLAITPVLGGRGVRLLDNVADGIAGYRVAELVSSPAVAHAVLVRA